MQPRIASWQMIQLTLKRPGYKLLWLKVWIVVFVLFLWLPRINLLSYIFLQAPISFGEKLGFVIDDLTRLVSLLANPLVLSMVVFSILAALSIVLLIFMVRTSKLLSTKVQQHRKAQVGVAAAAIGSHVLSCGGTLLLAPIFPALSGGNSLIGGTGATVNLWLGTGANLVGIALVWWAIRRTTRHTAHMLMTS